MEDYPLESMIRDVEALLNHPDVNNPDGIDISDPGCPFWLRCEYGVQFYNYILKSLTELKDLREKSSGQNKRGLYLL